jgi:hypothetical protein
MAISECEMCKETIYVFDSMYYDIDNPSFCECLKCGKALCKNCCEEKFECVICDSCKKVVRCENDSIDIGKLKCSCDSIYRLCYWSRFICSFCSLDQFTDNRLLAYLLKKYQINREEIAAEYRAESGKKTL